MSNNIKNKLSNFNSKPEKKRLVKKGERDAAVSNGIRGKYETLGVLGYYSSLGHEYENPHGDIVTKAIATIMSLHDFSNGRCHSETLRVLDLACGSGEVTIALEMWIEQTVSVPTFYVDIFHASSDSSNGDLEDDEEDSNDGFRPLEPVSKPLDNERVRRPVPMVAVLPPPQFSRLDIVACDPFTHEAYLRRTGRTAVRWSFEDVAEGHLSPTDPFDLCICSFALHLCDASRLFLTLWQLAARCRRLLLLSPHKRPHVRLQDGWQLERAFRVEKVHVRLYVSTQFEEG